MSDHRAHRDRCTVRGSAAPTMVLLAVLALTLSLAPAALAQIATGSYSGNGISGRSITGLSFSPAVVIIKGNDTEPALIHTSAIPLNRSKPLALGQEPSTGHILALHESGFIIGSSAAVNQSGVEYQWIAIAEEAGHVICGNYMGDGAASREIDGLGFEPGMVLLIPGNDTRCHLRTDQMPADASISLDDEELETGVLTHLTADGFRVSSDPQANESGTPYAYVAFARQPGRSFFGTYTGDGSANQVVHGAGFRPQWLLVKSTESKPGAHQTTELSGSGRTLNVRPEPDFADGINHFTGQGFTVGDHELVNEPDKTYFYAAFASGVDPVDQADLSVDLLTDKAVCERGEAFTLTATIANAGPNDATEAALQVDVPAGLQLLSFDADPGAISDLSTPQQIHLVWDLPAGQQRQVEAVYEVLTGPALRTFDAVVSAAAPPDPLPDDNTTSVTVAVPTADLALALDADNLNPLPGDPIEISATLANLGPDDAPNASVTLALPAGLALDDATPSSGTYDPGTGAWLPGLLPAGELATLLLRCSVDGDQAGQTLTVFATADQQRNDTANENNSDDLTITVAVPDPAYISVGVVPFAQEHRRLLPGGPEEDVLRLRLVNSGAQDADLSEASFLNPTTGAFGQTEQDAFWADVQLCTAEGSPLAAGHFSAGRFTAVDLALTLPPGETIDLILRGTAAISAPDGVALQPTLQSDQDLVFAEPITIQGDWPLTAPGTLTIDGMTAAQITLYPIGPEAFQMGSARNLVLDVVIPSNGGQPDVLNKLNVVNLGDATPSTVLTRVEAWADDGDGVFNAAADLRISQLHWTGGGRHEASALAIPIPSEGLRIFVTVDVAANALGGTVRMSLPAGDDVAINVASGNDGPIDEPVINPFTQTITATDRIVVSTVPIASQTIAPGEDRVALLHLVARNLYDHPHTLQRLRVRNLSVGSATATQADLDGTVVQLFLQADGNGNGQIDGPDTDPVVATTVWQDGWAVFEGVQWTLPPDTVRHLFLTANVSLFGTADGDSIAAAAGAAGDVMFLGEPAVTGSWPLDSGARHRVRGMVAAQVLCPEVPPISLAAGDGPALSLNFTVPSNGYMDDVLQSLRLTNQGSAGTTEIASLTLWADDGDGLFDPVTDTMVAALTSVGQDWITLDLDLPIPIGGRRLFAGLTVTETPTDSATVSLGLPVGALTMQSSNDGPRDAPVNSPSTLLISTAPLLSSFSFERPRSTTEMTISLTMQVANVSGEQIDAIQPVDLSFFGEASVSLLSGPEPMSIDLAPGSSGVFTWTLGAEGAGTFQATGNCVGVGAVGGQARFSLRNTSAVHRILEPAADLGLYPVVNMPFSINRGQTGIVPLTLTLLNDGGLERAEIRLERLVITLDDGENQPIVPAHLLSRAVVNEGVHIYCNQTQPETTGQTLTLDLQPPVAVTAREPATISLRLDIRPDTQVQRFRIGLMTANDLTVVDDVSEQSRGVYLSSGAFPVRTAAGAIVSQAVGLLVDSLPLQPTTAGAGQSGVELLRLSFDAQGDDLNSEVKVGSFAVSMRDTLGAHLADASAHLSRLWIQGPLSVHSLRQMTGPADSLVVFELTPQITVPVGTPSLEVSVYGDISDQPTLAPLRLHMEGPHRLDARDSNTGAAVPVTYQAPLLLGPVIVLQEPTPPLLAATTPRLPSHVGLGARNVAAMTLQITHPGTQASAAALLDTLRLICLDSARRLQDPRLALDACRLTWNTEDQAIPAILRSDQILFPLGRRLLAAGDLVNLTLTLDVRADAQTDALELVFDETGLDAVDGNLQTPLSLLPGSGQVLPGSSGLAGLQPASIEAVASWQDRLPAFLPAGDELIEAGRLVLTNPAPTGSAPLELASLRLRATTGDGSVAPAGSFLHGATVRIQDSPWATLVDVSAEDSVLVLYGSEPWILPAGVPQTLTLLVSIRAGSIPAGVRVGLIDGDLICRQPGGGGIVVVRPASGQSFPFWTAAAGQTDADLAGSYVNYPNPFAAGREQTSFVFNLQRPGRVSLRIWTSRGEPVITLLREKTRAGGLHQDISWDGLNGRGQTVLNGVYLAELTVSYPDGGSERVIRKVAVVR